MKNKIRNYKSIFLAEDQGKTFTRIVPIKNNHDGVYFLLKREFLYNFKLSVILPFTAKKLYDTSTIPPILKNTYDNTHDMLSCKIENKNMLLV